jgi:protein-tyrosine kinase
MSRIHEALKKAEQERLAGEGNGSAASDVAPASEAANVSALLDADTRPVAPPTVTDSSTTAAVKVAKVQGKGTPLDSDLRACVANCAPGAWSPDLKSFVSWNSNAEIRPGIEEMRTLRSRLYRIREKKPVKTVLVGSAMPEEGKTFISANLAHVLARQPGRRVLLLDGDLRKSRLHEFLGARSAPGLTEYLRGEADESAILQRSPVDGFYFIAGGKAASNPAELLSNGRLKTFLERMSPIFDWIIIDSAPVVPVADAAQMATLCDGVLLVVMAGSTSFELVQRAKSEFRHAPLMLGVVLNRVSKAQTYTSYYYHYGAEQKS